MDEAIKNLYASKVTGRSFKLSEEQVKEMMALLVSGNYTANELGRMFDCDHTTILRYRNLLNIKSASRAPYTHRPDYVSKQSAVRTKSVTEYAKRQAEKSVEREKGRLAYQDFLKTQTESKKGNYKELVRTVRPLECKHTEQKFHFKCLVCFHIFGSERQRVFRYQCAHLKWEKRHSCCGELIEIQEMVYSN